MVTGLHKYYFIYEYIYIGIYIVLSLIDFVSSTYIQFLKQKHRICQYIGTRFIQYNIDNRRRDAIY